MGQLSVVSCMMRVCRQLMAFFCDNAQRTTESSQLSVFALPMVEVIPDSAGGFSRGGGQRRGARVAGGRCRMEPQRGRVRKMRTIENAGRRGEKSLRIDRELSIYFPSRRAR